MVRGWRASLLTNPSRSPSASRRGRPGLTCSPEPARSSASIPRPPSRSRPRRSPVWRCHRCSVGGRSCRQSTTCDEPSIFLGAPAVLPGRGGRCRCYPPPRSAPGKSVSVDMQPCCTRNHEISSCPAWTWLRFRVCAIQGWKGYFTRAHISRRRLYKLLRKSGAGLGKWRDRPPFPHGTRGLHRSWGGACFPGAKPGMMAQTSARHVALDFHYSGCRQAASATDTNFPSRGNTDYPFDTDYPPPSLAVLWVGWLAASWVVLVVLVGLVVCVTLSFLLHARIREPAGTRNPRGQC